MLLVGFMICIVNQELEVRNEELGILRLNESYNPSVLWSAPLK